MAFIFGWGLIDCQPARVGATDSITYNLIYTKHIFIIMRNESAISAGWLADCSQTTTHNTHTIIGPINIKWALTKYGHFQALNDNSCPFVSLLIYIYSISHIFKEEEEGQMKPQTKQNKTERNETKQGTFCDILHYDIHTENNRNSRKFQNVNNWAETQHRSHFYASIFISKF